MRDELHLMELVDRYLDGEMADAERSSFEGRMRESNELRELVEDQRALREGLHRVRLRGALASAHRGWVIKRWAPWIAAALIVVFGTYRLLTSKSERDTHAAVPGVIDQAIFLPADTGRIDTVPASEEINTQVESVFVRTMVRTRAVLDTARGEGRVVTRLITERCAPVAINPSEGSTAATTTEAEIGVDHRPGTEIAPQFGDEDRWPQVTNADSANTPPEQKELLARVERLQNATKPVFPGGMEAMQSFLDDNVKQPRGNRKAGMVMVGFTVNKKGEVVNVEVVRGMGRLFDAEALRVVGSMPAWEPSRLGDRPVKSHVEVPVRFQGKAKRERGSRETRPQDLVK